MEPIRSTEEDSPSSYFSSVERGWSELGTLQLGYQSGSSATISPPETKEPTSTQDPPCISGDQLHTISPPALIATDIPSSRVSSWLYPLSSKDFLSAMNIDIDTERTWSCFPSQEMDTSKVPERYEDQLFDAATFALNSYNSEHQFHFELEHPLHMEVFRAPSKLSSRYPVSLYKHLSFISRSKESPGILKLLFAEVCDDTIVNTCVPVEPGNPFFPLRYEECHPKGVIYHPQSKYEAGGY